VGKWRRHLVDRDLETCSAASRAIRSPPRLRSRPCAIAVLFSTRRGREQGVASTALRAPCERHPQEYWPITPGCIPVEAGRSRIIWTCRVVARTRRGGTRISDLGLPHPRRATGGAGASRSPWPTDFTSGAGSPAGGERGRFGRRAARSSGTSQRFFGGNREAPPPAGSARLMQRATGRSTRSRHDAVPSHTSGVTLTAHSP